MARSANPTRVSEANWRGPGIDGRPRSARHKAIKNETIFQAKVDHLLTISPLALIGT
jgi:hypothetical protein